jgi:hypothetical protein
MATAGAAAAQETYGDLYEQGALSEISQMEQKVGRLLRQHGVPDSCLAQLTLSDASNISAAIDADESRSTKETRVRMILEDRCRLP